MANADRPCGFRPYGQVRQVVEMEAGSACYPGDCVNLDTDGQVDPAAAGETILGVCLDYASAAGQKVRVSVHPEQLYIVQADEADISAQALVGTNCDILATGGSSTYKASRMELDSSTSATASAQCTVIGLYGEVNNAFGAQAEVLVRINEHQAFGKDAFAGV